MKDLYQNLSDTDKKELRYALKISVVTISVLGLVALFSVATGLHIAGFTLTYKIGIDLTIILLIATTIFLVNKRKLNDLRNNRQVQSIRFKPLRV